MALFEIAVILEEDEDKDGNVLDEELVVEPEYVMAKSDKTAAYKFFLKNADKLAKHDPERIKVLVRPFS